MSDQQRQGQQMDPKQMVNELRQTRDNLNRIRTGLQMSNFSDMSETQSVINDIDVLLSDSDNLRNELMDKAGM